MGDISYNTPMDTQLQRQLIRQLKLLNFWITTFGVLFLAGLAIILYLLFQTVMFVRDTGEKIQAAQTEVRDSVNVKKQVCEGEGSFSNFIRASTDACK